MSDIKTTFSKALKFLLTEFGLKQNAVAAKLGISAASLNDYVKGRREGDEKTRRRIADALNVTYDHMLLLGSLIAEGKDPAGWRSVIISPGSAAIQKISDEDLMTISAAKKAGINLSHLLTNNTDRGPGVWKHHIPLISFVQAGGWAEAVEEFTPTDAEEFFSVTSPVGPRTFALLVVGNSMEPEFLEGDIIIVDPDREAETGAFVVAKINHDEATFKQLIRDGGSVFLRPLNSAYPIMDVTGRDLRIVGRVVEKVKRY